MSSARSRARERRRPRGTESAARREFMAAAASREIAFICNETRDDELSPGEPCERRGDRKEGVELVVSRWKDEYRPIALDRGPRMNGTVARGRDRDPRQDRALELVELLRARCRIPRPRLPSLPVGVERVRLPARPVQREHQLDGGAREADARPRALELADEPRVATEGELRRRSAARARPAAILEPRDRRLGEPRTRGPRAVRHARPEGFAQEV